MRKIVFRGRRKDGKWLYGDLIHNRGGVYIADDSVVSADIQGHTDFSVMPESVGQFTGVVDCNGKDIYEGDILQHCRDKVTMEVGFLSSQFICTQHWDDQDGEGSVYGLDEYNLSRWQVLGSIHDTDKMQ